ncbi:methyl-accepting chemotaxis protein [Desulfuromonas soudanensis]|uniref:Methyl-accepting chemotaxis protein n=1 Tax=Desulfuromonas soudanensis TaxID=1603606 RepID=A0A0M3QEY9_9BACT|nr:methyl-accepting chemotaxis protein [Desulfuromonas soudanensis]ALC15143.1 methyl-accepting chemotaxis protein [Desulfuromonas soudanensis]
MAEAGNIQISYLRKVFFFTHMAGIMAGLVFPFPISLIIGPEARSLPFVLGCVIMGFAVGATMYQFVRVTLKKQLRQQLVLFRPMIGEIDFSGETVEGMQAAIEAAVGQVDSLVQELLSTVDKFVPHYRGLADSSQYLSERAQEGLAAAGATRRDVEGMEQKQKEIATQIETLSHRTQDESAISRQLSASLEEMASAMDHSTSQFLETTTSVDEVASSVREVGIQAAEIAHSVEGTAQNLDAIDESLEKIRAGAKASAKAAEAVKEDAESGLNVVKISIEEMERIEQESQRAKEAMARLSLQTGEVAKIIEVIKELVSDTELLAFNAAIIAAKAGDEGRGFSVVAEEIRDLADRTTTSAQDIHRIVMAIGEDTREVTEAVDATGQRISRGKELSLSTGEALRKIVASSRDASTSSDEISALTGREGERARALLNDAGGSLQSVKAIARAIQEQQTAIARIQEGVNQMKGASDQIGRGMEEQVRANREFHKGLGEREGQIQAITEATRFQMQTTQRVFVHFETSEKRLRKNADRSKIINSEISELEILAGRLRELGDLFASHRA